MNTLPEAWKPFTKEPDAAPVVTAEQLELVKRTVATGATVDELKLYLYDCQRQGVHPLDKLIHFTKRSGKYTPITSIDFMRTRAADTGEYAGSDDAVFARDDDMHHVEAASVTVWRFVQGQRCPFTATARWSEYKPEQNDFMWKRMPHTMLAKCAEALALRKGFPKQLAGLYAREEMDQAETAPLVKAPHLQAQQPAVAGGEVIETATRPDAPAGYCYIEECTPGRGKKAGEVTLSNGEVAMVWASDGKLFDLAVALCQEGKPVKATLVPGKGNYGPTLKGLTRLDAEHDQRTEGDWTTDVPPPDQ